MNWGWVAALVVVWSVIPFALWVKKKQDRRLREMWEEDQRAVKQWLKKEDLNE